MKWIQRPLSLLLSAALIFTLLAGQTIDGITHTAVLTEKAKEVLGSPYQILHLT